MGRRLKLLSEDFPLEVQQLDGFRRGHGGELEACPARLGRSLKREMSLVGPRRVTADDIEGNAVTIGELDGAGPGQDPAGTRYRMHLLEHHAPASVHAFGQFCRELVWGQSF